MSINMEFLGLEDLIKIADNIATEEDRHKVDTQILKECGDLAYENVKGKIHRSRDHSKSGPKHKGTERKVPPKNAADAIPRGKVKKKKDCLYVCIGWEKSDNSPYFYTKMEEWGTSKRPPHHSFGTVNKELKDKYNIIAKKYYEKLIKKLEGR